MSDSGSFLVYRDELSLAFARAPMSVAGRGPRMAIERIKQATQGRYPEYKLTRVFESKNPSQAVEIPLERIPSRV